MIGRRLSYIYLWGIIAYTLGALFLMSSSSGVYFSPGENFFSFRYSLEVSLIGLVLAGLFLVLAFFIKENVRGKRKN